MTIICKMSMICDISADNEDTKRKLLASRPEARSSQRSRCRFLHPSSKHVILLDTYCSTIYKLKKENIHSFYKSILNFIFDRSNVLFILLIREIQNFLTKIFQMYKHFIRILQYIGQFGIIIYSIIVIFFYQISIYLIFE